MTQVAKNSKKIVTRKMKEINLFGLTRWDSKYQIVVENQRSQDFCYIYANTLAQVKHVVHGLDNKTFWLVKCKGDIVAADTHLYKGDQRYNEAISKSSFAKV